MRLGTGTTSEAQPPGQTRGQALSKTLRIPAFGGYRFNVDHFVFVIPLESDFFFNQYINLKQISIDVNAVRIYSK